MKLSLPSISSFEIRHSSFCSNVYYYNDKWQVLCDYNDSGNLQAWFAYGNYIDEALITGKWYTWYCMRYYVHDHLYSPVALTNYTGVLERYEYDSYGNCHIMDASYNPRSTSLYANPYLFTGRRVDILDNGSLKLQYNRNRYYDQYTGRFFTHDPFGMSHHLFPKSLQYSDGLSLYQYVRSNPIGSRDPLGLWGGDWDPRDIFYLGRFITHRYFGDGSLWTAGAANLRRQNKLKTDVSRELKNLAQNICQNMRHSGDCSKGGTLNISLTGPMCSTHGMRASLNGPNPVFKITGSYLAFASSVGMKCYCVVNFQNRYIWFDQGDLNYEHIEDRILRALELYGFYFHDLPDAVDFPIRIRWWDASVYMNERRSNGTVRSYPWGWPFD